MGKLRDFMSAKEVEMFDAFEGQYILELGVDQETSELIRASAYVGLVNTINALPDCIPKSGQKYMKSLGRVLNYNADNYGYAHYSKDVQDSLIYPEEVE